MMKCAACGYEHTVKTQEVDKVIRYQSGKRKGEIKSIETEVIKFEVGHSDFHQLYFKKDVDQIGYDSGDWREFIETDLYACPECGTIKIKV